MKILLLPFNPAWTPHFETELELIVQHQECGDDVYLLVDDGRLTFTVSDPYNSYDMKKVSTSRLRQGLELIKFPKRNIIKINKKLRDAGVIPPKFCSYEELQNFKIAGAELGRGVISTITSLARDNRFDVEAYADFIYRGLWSSLLVYESMVDAIARYNPDVVYIFNGRFAELWAAAEACKRCKVTFRTHERGCNIHSYAVYENSSLHDIETLKKEVASIGSAYEKNIAEKWFFDRRLGKDQGWFSYVKEQKKQQLPPNFDTSKMNIAIFNSSLDEYESFSAWNTPFYANENEGIRMIFDSFAHHSGVHFYVRMHPNLKGLDNTQVRELYALRYSHVTIIDPDAAIDSYALLDACDKIVTFSSTIGVEGCYWGKPVILAGRAIYENLNCCYSPSTHQQLVDYLKADLDPLPLQGALQYAYWQSTYGRPFKHFNATGYFQGTFMGQNIVPRFSIKDRIDFKLHYLAQRIKKYAAFVSNSFFDF
jgi:hypothetical protein